MYRLLKPLLFRMSPEAAHHRTVALLRATLKIPGASAILRRQYRYDHPSLEREVAGLTFRNPVGLAAGFDKDGKYYHQMAQLGFGHIEIGTVTPRPQAGNPQPRLFRLVGDEALINRMGFNNDGVDAMADRLRKYGKPEGVILGGNIGKNKDTPNDRAVDDYALCFERLFDLVDYFVVNVSSPNTPGLRDLQDKEPLTLLLRHLMEMNRSHASSKPLFLKIAPDLIDAQLDDIISIVADTGISGVIATNTTIDRSILTTSAQEVASIGNGGLSGRPLSSRSTEVIRYLHHRSGGTFPIIGVGGIYDATSAKAKLDAGASLVQIYSGMVYRGPSLVKEIAQGLV